MASNEEKKKKIESEVERTRMIKAIAQDIGFKDAYELQKILKDRYNVEVHVDTLYNDLMRIELFEDEDLRAFENRVMANCQSHLDNLNAISVKAKYEQYRIKAIDSYFKNIPDIIKMLHACARRRKPKTKTEEVEEEEELEVKFS